MQTLNQPANLGYEDLIKRIFRSLKGTKAFLTLDESSKLNNIWEEFCMQLQRAEPGDLEPYKLFIEDFVYIVVANLNPDNHKRIWYQTPQAISRKNRDKYEINSQSFNRSLAQKIRKDLVGKAYDYDNSRIIRFLKKDLRLKGAQM